jgi:YHS domain-containing protein
MRTFAYTISAGLLALSMSAFAGEFNNECAWGLANDKHVVTDCSVSSVGGDGKTYCFSSEASRDAFMKDPETNAKKALERFGRK